MRKVIAVDFDGCLCTDAWPLAGKPNWGIINRAKEEQAAGAALILWTCREGHDLDTALAACSEWGLTFDAVNDNVPELKEAWGNDTRKVGATEYWDDRAVRMPGGWIGVKYALPEDTLESSDKRKQIKVLTAIKAKNGYTVRSQLRMKHENWYTGDVRWDWKYSAGEVTHWMPLPEPPRKEE